MENKGEKKTPRKKEIFLKNSTTNLCCHYWISGYGFLFFIIYFWLLLQSKKVDPFGTFIHSFIQSSVSCPFFWQKCFRHIQRPFFCLLHTIFLIQNCVFFSLLFFLQTKFLKNCYHSKKKIFNFSSNNIVSDFFFDFNFVFSIFVIQSSLVLQSVFCFPIGSCKLNFVSSHSFFVGVAIQRLFCFVLFCFVVFWGWVFKKRECFGFCRVVFFFFPLILVKAFFVLFLFFQCRESGFAKTLGRRRGGGFRTLIKQTLLLLLLLLLQLLLWLCGFPRVSSGFVFLCTCIATAVQKKKKKKGACAFSRAGGRWEGEGGKKKPTQILSSHPSFSWVVKERANKLTGLWSHLACLLAGETAAVAASIIKAHLAS